MSGVAKKLSTSQWRNAVKMGNLKKKDHNTNALGGGGGGVRSEWRHFSPREKGFILNAISACTSSEGVNDIFRDFADAVDYMQGGNSTD